MGGRLGPMAYGIVPFAIDFRLSAYGGVQNRVTLGPAAPGHSLQGVLGRAFGCQVATACKGSLVEPLGAKWPPKAAKEDPKADTERQHRPQERPKTANMRPKTANIGPKSGPRPPT